MNEADLLKIAVAGGWTSVAILCAITVYRAGVHMIPVWAERYKLHTHRLTVKDAERAETIAKKVNGALAALSLHDIERGLANSTWFREHVIDARLNSSHRLSTIEGAQQRISLSLSEHVREDREVHERVKALEVQVEDVKGDVREIRETIREGAAAVTREAKEIRKEQAEGERRIISRIDPRPRNRGTS